MNHHDFVFTLGLIEAERAQAGAKSGASINFASSHRGFVCRLHGSRTYTGYGPTMERAWSEASRQLMAAARGATRESDRRPRAAKT